MIPLYQGCIANILDISHMFPSDINLLVASWHNWMIYRLQLLDVAERYMKTCEIRRSQAELTG